MDASTRGALAAAVAAFDPDKPQSVCCSAHQWDCPSDSPRWRDFYDRLVVAIQDLQAWRERETFEQWLARATRDCREATDRERMQHEANRDAEQEATRKGAESAKRWLAENVPQPREVLRRLRPPAPVEGA